MGRDEEDNITVNSAMLSNVLKVLTSDPARPITLRHVIFQTGTAQYMGPVHFEAPVVYNGPPFSEDMPRLPYPNIYYNLEAVVKSYGSKFIYTIHRPSIIIGIRL